MENKKTEIDIILPNYNSSEYIDETIQSVLKQNFTNWRLIIIDDFSNIYTQKKIKKYENWEINHIMREKNLIADKLSKQGRKKGK